jgi:hypothetical protein
MRDRYFIDEPTMRRLIASLDHTVDRDVSQLQRFVAKLCGLKLNECSLSSRDKHPVRRTG